MPVRAIGQSLSGEEISWSLAGEETVSPRVTKVMPNLVPRQSPTRYLL